MKSCLYYSTQMMKSKERQDGPQISQQLKTIMKDLKCVNGHTIERICDNNQCSSPALFCIQKNCVQCLETHKYCRSYSFEVFSKLIQKRSSGTIAEFIQKISQKQSMLIEMIQKHKRKYLQPFVLDQNTFNIDRQYFTMVEDIYKHRNSQAINGKQASQLFLVLQETQIDTQSRQSELLQTFSNQAQRIMKQYMQVKDWIYDSVLGHEKYRKMVKEKKQDILAIQSACLIDKNLNMTLHNLIQSTNKKVSMFAKIIQEELEAKDKIFIKDMFGVPNLKFQKVYTASHNDFSASRFHEICDHIENTFIIVRNEFGKTFAGFTSLTWFGDNTFKSDEENRSFIISFDENVKLSLFNRSKAIYCSQSLGPTFGGDNYLKIFTSYDLLIGDKCHAYASSYYEFPKSYQFHQRSTETVNIFGVEKGKKFKILQYQVYKVSILE